MTEHHPTAAIADDDPFMREALREQLQALWPEHGIVVEASVGPEALRALTAHRPSLAFLDIRMPDLSGLQVAQLLESKTQLVFVTAYDNHALEAFDTNAGDYLLKPLAPALLTKVVIKLLSRLSTARNDSLAQADPRSVRDAMEQAAQGSSARMEWLHVLIGHQVRMAHVEDGAYFESDTKYTRMVVRVVDKRIRSSLKDLVPQPPPGIHSGAPVRCGQPVLHSSRSARRRQHGTGHQGLHSQAARQRGQSASL